MSDFHSSWQGYDFSWLNDTLSHVREMARQATEAMQRVKSIVQPISETIKQYKPKIVEIGQVLEEVSRQLLAIRKMGEAQYVCWNYISPEFAEVIIDTENMNKTLREHMLHDRYREVNSTIDKTLSSPVMHKYKRLYSQCVNAFHNGECDLAVTGFTSVFDGLLADTSKNPAASLGPRIDVIKKKLENEELLNHDEYAMLTLALTFEKTLDSFSARSDFKGKEPKNLNRHWIAHGRSSKRRTKLDCVKMINLIYGLLLIEELGSSTSTDSFFDQGE